MATSNSTTTIPETNSSAKASSIAPGAKRSKSSAGIYRSQSAARKPSNKTKPAAKSGTKGNNTPSGRHAPATDSGASKTDGTATFREGSKGATVTALLRKKDGATIAQLAKATGWQNHSVRGFLSGTLKKKHGITVASEKASDGERRYRIAS